MNITRYRAKHHEIMIQDPAGEYVGLEDIQALASLAMQYLVASEDVISDTTFNLNSHLGETQSALYVAAYEILKTRTFSAKARPLCGI